MYKINLENYFNNEKIYIFDSGNFKFNLFKKHLTDYKEFTATAAITPLQYSMVTREKRGSKDMNCQKIN